MNTPRHSPSNIPIKSWLIMAGGVLLLIAVIGGAKFSGVKKEMDVWAAMGEPKSTVSTVKAAYQEWQPSITAVGTLRAVRGVELAPEVAGRVGNINFLSGDEAKAGDVLVQLVIDGDQARLQSLKADANLAESNARRALLQLEAKAISQAAADAEQAKLLSARAAVTEQEALITRKTIRAPFSGRLGISAVNPGQYLNPGDKVVTLQQLDPIHADFTLPQAELARVHPGLQIAATTDAFPGQVFKGQISAINPVVDANTRNIRVQATLKNPQYQLLPGMFTNIQVTAGEAQRHLTLPQNAVAFNPYGETVFVIVPRGQENAPDPNKPAQLLQAETLKAKDAELKAAEQPQQAQPPAPQQPGDQTLVARQVFIKVGPARGDQVAILSGIKEGDEVVTSGQLKLKNGTAVQINNTVQPSDNPDPKPVDD